MGIALSGMCAAELQARRSAWQGLLQVPIAQRGRLSLSSGRALQGCTGRAYLRGTARLALARQRPDHSIG